MDSNKDLSDILKQNKHNLDTIASNKKDTKNDSYRIVSKTIKI